MEKQLALRSCAARLLRLLPVDMGEPGGVGGWGELTTLSDSARDMKPSYSVFCVLPLQSGAR